jgi:ABC-type multidrug transport system fused ATPase/permease subunit
MDVAERRRFFVLLCARTSSSLLDLIGILLLGAVGSIVVELQTSGDRVVAVQRLLNLIGLERASSSTSMAVLAAIAVAFFVLKGVSSSILNYRVFQLLGRNEIRIGEQALLQAARKKNVRQLTATTQSVGVDLSSGVMAGFTRLLGYFVIFVGEFVSLAVVAFILLFVDPLTSIGAVVFFGGIGFLLQRVISRRAHDFGELLARSTSRTIQVVQETLSLSREISLAGRDESAATRYRLAKNEVTASNARLLTLGTIPRHVIDTSLLVGTALMAALLFGTKNPDDAGVSLGLFLIAGARLTPSILALQGALSAMAQAAREGDGALGRVGSSSLHFNQNSVASVTANKMIDRKPAAIVLDSATFEIDGVTLLKDVTLSISAGTFVGIVGPSGAGKTTLVDLLLGLPPTKGRVLIDNLTPLQCQQNDPGSIAFVPQTPVVLDASLAENVSLMTSGFDEHRIHKCLSLAGLSSLGVDISHSLELCIGASGRTLSGGEAQRLGIARALYCNPRLIVMDEPTSALDAETEEVITSLIESLAGHTTMVVVAHRLSTIQNADLVVSLSNGSVTKTQSRR